MHWKWDLLGGGAIENGMELLRQPLGLIGNRHCDWSIAICAFRQRDLVKMWAAKWEERPPLPFTTISPHVSVVSLKPL